MSRRNEIKADIWEIMRDVYSIGDHRECTDKQNEFLNRVVNYLSENISLRRKKDKGNDEVDDAPLLKPQPTAPPLVIPNPNRPPPEDLLDRKKGRKKKETAKAVSSPSKAETPKIDVSALPEHLRKYVK